MLRLSCGTKAYQPKGISSRNVSPRLIYSKTFWSLNIAFKQQLFLGTRCLFHLSPRSIYYRPIWSISAITGLFYSFLSLLLLFSLVWSVERIGAIYWSCKHLISARCLCFFSLQGSETHLCRDLEPNIAKK